MLKNDLLSVIVPIHNVEDYLDKCIHSIQKSSYNNLQIILVDDGSTDSSGNICDRLAEKDDRIIVIHKENGGLVSARKAGVDAAIGEFSAFVDGDDFVGAELFSSALNNMKTTNVDFVTFGMKLYYDSLKDEKTETGCLPDGVYRADDYVTYTVTKNERLPFLHNAVTKIFKTGILKQIIGNVDNHVNKGEDLNISLAYLKQCRTFFVNNHICEYYYVMRDSSITHKYDNNSIEHVAWYIKSTMKLLDEDGSEKARLWNKLIFNEAFNLVMSDCIGCALAHYGKRGIFFILMFFGRLSKDTVIQRMFTDGVRFGYYEGPRSKFAALMRDGKIYRAFVMRVRKQVR
jgi:glycosyltransferase involved in cell wall biosynthesis